MSKASKKSPICDKPSRGGAGGPSVWPSTAASLLVPGVEVSNWWLILASDGKPKRRSMNFKIELCSYNCPEMRYFDAHLEQALALVLTGSCSVY